MQQNVFSQLTPDAVISAAESFTGLRFDGTIVPYNSYVNRVFGITTEDQAEYVIKFYRPGRWNEDAVRDEHSFLLDCASSEVPVVSPVGSCTDSGRTIGTCSAEGSPDILFAVFPRLRARTFDIYCDDDYIRTGSAIGRMHAAGAGRSAPHRLQCTPQQTTIPYINSLISRGMVPAGLVQEFAGVCNDALDYIEDAYASCFGEADSSGMYAAHDFIRIHGDCHRGNILENESDALTLIDFDDMMTGPAIQDLWLLLPGYRKDSLRELGLLMEGYESFIPGTGPCSPIRRQARLIEPLRFMRHIYFLAWTAIQHEDEGFAERYPGWGTKAFWETEIEDLRTQLHVMEDDYAYFNSAVE